ncbi:NAD(P)-dependent oxidoreductase [Labrys monachus]|uniref:Glyoxylate/hydroxypyruvate reductase A n=1 Tax=Labrys monachus TaxID=217067 RepID=A0ABU0FH33_9HYPH|nr:NAD(P)-dependent oxidoreductase [Labrys monachus]MDQ0393375.1 glyoxylate/hydroxypyruvate reductase A [Labrys monachus]
MLRILLADPLAYDAAFDAVLAELAPHVETYRWPDGPADGRYDVLAAWRLPDGFGVVSDSVKLVFCFGAGADHLLADPRLPAHPPVVRLLDAGQAAQLVDYAHHVAFARLQNDQKYLDDQRRHLWDPAPSLKRTRATTRVAVLGLGPIGTDVATALAATGFAVRAWSRRPRRLEGIDTSAGAEGLPDCVRSADVLVNLLPLHPQTADLLGEPLFSLLADGAYVANLGRGGHLDELALRGALDSGRIGCAWIDAFGEEPLPSSHWLWTHDRVRLTPHVGGLPTPAGSARSLAAAIAAYRAGAPLPGLVRAAAATRDTA